MDHKASRTSRNILRRPGETNPSSQVALQRRILGLLKASRNHLQFVYSRIRLSLGLKPLSYLWGSDRGLPVHRYYLGQFLEEYASDISGNCLEFQEDGYTSRYGGTQVKKLDILHKEEGNPKATLVADITEPNQIPSNSFDCIICTHVLHVIPELKKAVVELYRILKPGGVLLAAVPLISMYDQGWHELWRFTPEGLRFVLETSFATEQIVIKAYGNSLTAAGEIRGVVAREFTSRELNSHDERFSIEVCARARKLV